MNRAHFPVSLGRSAWHCLRVGLALCVWLIAGPVGWAANYAVAILNDEFAPRNITIAPGDTIVWTNVGGGTHSVESDTGVFSSSASGQEAISPDATFRHTFTGIGLYPYYCAFHGSPGGLDMAGVIRVADPAENNNPATPVNVTPAPDMIGVTTAPTLSASAFSDTDVGDFHLASQWIVRNTATGVIVLDTNEDATHKRSIPIMGLDGGTNFGWKVRYKDDRGGWSEYSVETRFTTIATQGGPGTGLRGTYARYLASRDIVTVVTTRIDPVVNFDWRLNPPIRGVPANNFFVRWEGTVVPEFTEQYRFRVRADGGVRLWVNGQLIIDDWIAGPFAIFRNKVVPLEASVPVTIKLEYFDALGFSSINLRWSSRSQPTQVIPQARLFPPAP